jgi:hypothetical protein
MKKVNIMVAIKGVVNNMKYMSAMLIIVWCVIIVALFSGCVTNKNFAKLEDRIIQKMYETKYITCSGCSALCDSRRIGLFAIHNGTGPIKNVYLCPECLDKIRK